MVIEKIKQIIKTSLLNLGIKENNEFLVEKSKSITLGDFSTNICLTLAKTLKKNPVDFANELKQELEKNNLFKKITISQPGFINFFLSDEATKKLINDILEQKDEYGKFPLVNDDVYSVEYVSANPTGYLHVGHARNAVLGNCIINLLEWTGHKTVSEYVVNDAGNQMNNLATAVLIRYLQLFKKDIQLPEDSYHGQEIIDVAEALKAKYNDQFVDLEIDENYRIIDKDACFTIRWFARDYLLDIIKKDLHELGVDIQYYYSEYQTHKQGIIEKMIDDFVKNGIAYKKDGAYWLKTTIYGDDKDRVLIKSNGEPTYFAPDIYYHQYKLSTNGTRYTISVWGADHYSYISRMRAALLALGYQDEQFKIVTMQMVRLVKDGKDFKMSKRTGQSVTCHDITSALGKDVARWFLVSQSANNHIEIDVDISTKNDSSNPYYYVQYAYARACALFNKKEIKTTNDFNLLTSDLEREIINNLHLFKYTILNAANTYEPYKISVYLSNLAKLFHSYYTNTKIFDDNNKALEQQYTLVKAIAQVIKNGLTILGIKALERM